MPIGHLAGPGPAEPQHAKRFPYDFVVAARCVMRVGILVRPRPRAVELAANDFAGTLHLAGNTRINRYDMACRIAERLGYPSSLVRATDSNAMQGRAPRPNDASLDNATARSVLDTPMQSLMDGLELVLTAKEKQQYE